MLGVVHTYQRLHKALLGEGKGVLMSNDEDVVTWKGHGIGRFWENGKISWRGSILFETESTVKLASISNTVGIFEYQIDEAGNSFDKTWEWK